MGFFGKKSSKDAPEDTNRNALFGNRNATSPAPSQAPSIAPSTSSGYSSAAPSYSSQPSVAGANPYAAPRSNNAYGAAPSGGSGGYGGYGTAPNAPSGGYGGYGNPGLNRNDSADSGRDQLFGGASQRQQPSQQPSQGGYGQSSGGYGQQGPGQQSSGYGQDRHLTAEEEEEEDVEAVKQQIRFTKQESVSSTRNALRVAAQAEETGRNTLTRLGAQGERLHNTEKNLDIASNHNRVAEQKARELKTLNGSMFAVHIKNPLASKSRAQEEERRILERHQSDRDEREKTRQFGFESKNRVDNALKSGGSVGPSSKMSLAERSKYQFEGDDSDDEKEREIENNLDALGAVTGRLRGLAMATSQEVDRQNVQIDKIMKKVRFSPLLIMAGANQMQTERSCGRPNRGDPQSDQENSLVGSATFVTQPAFSWPSFTSSPAVLGCALIIETCISWFYILRFFSVFLFVGEVE